MAQLRRSSVAGPVHSTPDTTPHGLERLAARPSREHPGSRPSRANAPQRGGGEEHVEVVVVHLCCSPPHEERCTRKHEQEKGSWFGHWREKPGVAVVGKSDYLPRVIDAKSGGQKHGAW